MQAEQQKQSKAERIQAIIDLFSVDDDDDEAVVNHWHTCIEDNSYEINDIYPYNIRRIGKQKCLSEHVNESKGGYVFVAMNGKKKRKHVIVAKQFIPNDDPENKTEVDHLDGDKTNYHIENLRWTTHQENMQNTHSYKGVVFKYIDELPDDSEELTQYGKHELDGYFINTRRKAVYRQITENRYRKLKLLVSGGSRFYCVTATNGKHIQIAYKQLFG